jgi:hypothetical protein
MTKYAVNPVPLNLQIGPEFNLWTAGIATTFPSANSARLDAFQVRRPVVVSTAWFRVVTQSGNMDIGIYSDAGSLFASTGSFAVPAAAPSLSRAFAAGAGVILVPGVRYWRGFACDNAVAVFLNYVGVQTPAPPGYITSGAVAASFPLPPTIAIPTASPASNILLHASFT